MYVALEDIHKASSSVKKTERLNSAEKHFIYFLLHYFKILIGITRLSQMTIEHLKLYPKLIDTFATYLCRHAHMYCDEKKPLLAMNTAIGYFSSIKTYFTRNMEDAHLLYCFSPERMKSASQAMSKEKKKVALIEGKRAINSATPATRKQVCALAAVCLWCGSPVGIIFFAFNRLIYHLVARSCEGASQRKSDLATEEM